eukprot:s1800_g9.t1
MSARPEVTEMQASHAKELKDLDSLQRQTEERAFRAEKQVKVGEDEIARLHETEKTCRFEIEDLRVRLQDAERAEELHRMREKVEFLEDELRKTRHLDKEIVIVMHNEAEDLRKELMEYVAERKFWDESHEWQDNIRPELCQKLGVPNIALEPPEATVATAIAKPLTSTPSAPLAME